MQYQTLIVDGPYLAHRSYSAPYQLKTKDGRDSTMIHSFIRSLNSLRKQFNPNQILIAWESHGTPSWRREQYPAYKPSQPMDIQYVSELKDLQRLLHLFDVQQYNAPNNEADDVIAKLVKVLNYNNEPEILIFTVDKDMMQLVGEQCQVYDGKVFYNINKVKEKYFVWPEQIPDLLAIAGDKSDNIQGIQGFGFKKAAKLIEEHGSVEGMSFSSCSSNMEMSMILKQKILKNKELTKLNFDCVLESIPKEEVKEAIESIFDKYELVKMKEKIEEYKLLG